MTDLEAIATAKAAGWTLDPTINKWRGPVGSSATYTDSPRWGRYVCEDHGLTGRPRHWVEVTEERYDEMLGCLPPRMMLGHGFLVGEPSTHRLCTVSGHVMADYGAFVRAGGRYFEACPCMTAPEFKALNPADVLAYVEATQ